MGKTVPYVHWRMVLFGDTDAAKVVYTPRFSDYCMEAAEFWFREYVEIDWFHHSTELGLGTPVVHMELDFTAALIGNDKLGIVVRVGNLGSKSVTLEFEGRRYRGDDDTPTVCFNAKFIFCFIETESRKAITITDDNRILIESYITGCKVKPL